jgi:hypothetical protein
LDLLSLAERIEASRLSEWLTTNLKAIPIIEAVHVMAVAVVFGTILIVDLRLLGFPNTRRSYTTISKELLRFTWTAFIVAAVTGALMFVADATAYYANTPFRFKMLALVAAGVNMAIFENIAARSVATWDRNAPTPFAVRAAGLASILIWIAVIFFGRWTGFTQDYNFEVPQDVELDFDFLQDAPAPDAAENE